MAGTHLGTLEGLSTDVDHQPPPTRHVETTSLDVLDVESRRVGYYRRIDRVVAVERATLDASTTDVEHVEATSSTSKRNEKSMCRPLDVRRVEWSSEQLLTRRPRMSSTSKRRRARRSETTSLRDVHSTSSCSGRASNSRRVDQKRKGGFFFSAILSFFVVHSTSSCSGRASTSNDK